MSVFFTRRGKAPQRVNYVMWLESDGNAFINTGIYPNQNTKVEIVFSSKYGAGSDYSTVFGAQVGWGSNSFSMGSYTVSFGAQYSTALTLNDNEEHTAVLGEGKLQVDGIYIWAVSQAQTFQITCPMYLFGNNENNNVLYRSKAKVFRCQIYDNDVLVRDFRPCYDPEGVACLYDRVGRKYYYNMGSGEFVAGSSDSGGGVGSDEPVLITFSLDNRATCQAEEGMTWAHWMNSSYNTEGVKMNGNELYHPPTDGFIYYTDGSGAVKLTDKIISGYIYGLY